MVVAGTELSEFSRRGYLMTTGARPDLMAAGMALPHNLPGSPSDIDFLVSIHNQHGTSDTFSTLAMLVLNERHIAELCKMMVIATEADEAVDAFWSNRPGYPSMVAQYSACETIIHRIRTIENPDDAKNQAEYVLGNVVLKARPEMVIHFARRMAREFPDFMKPLPKVLERYAHLLS
jgi:hypothetical protein